MDQQKGDFIEKNLSLPTVLIVDDVQENLFLLGKTLSSSKYKTFPADSGKRALEILAEHYAEIDLILLDVMMPGLDGYETLKIIRQNENYQDIPVIFLTARNDKQDIIQGLNAGAVDYITKPFSFPELIARVNTHVELRRSRLEIQRMYEHVRSLNAAKDKFFSIIAHDLRNPFHSLLGLSGILNETPESLPPETIKNFAGLIHTTAQRTYRLLENLLHWARMQMKAIEVYHQNLILRKSAESAIEVLASLAESKEVVISNNIPQETVVFFDSVLLETVLRNIISNAIKFTNRGGFISISARESDDNQRIIISIEDNGIGMSQELLDKLFHIDKSTSRSGTENEIGTGLGLILCYEIIHSNGGTMTVESKEAEGTRIFINLPKGNQEEIS